MLIDSSSNFQLVFVWGHPHSTYTQRGRGGVKPNAFHCVQGRRVQGCVRTEKKIFLTTKSQNFSFFVQRKLLPFVIVYKKV